MHKFETRRIGKSMTRISAAGLGALTCGLILAAPAAAQQADTDYTLETCNKIDETVYFTLAHFVKVVKPEEGQNGQQYKAEGWWTLEPGECQTTNMTELWVKNGIPPAALAEGNPVISYIYGETEGFLGIVKKVWEDKTPGAITLNNVFCIRMPKDRAFFTLRGYSDRGTRLSNACSASTYDKVSMHLLQFDGNEKIGRFNFGGKE